MPRHDPRPARSRAKLLHAATGLLEQLGPADVTVDAVVATADVSRATFYRHFSSTTELVAAAFAALIPPAPVPSNNGSVRDRLIELVLTQARVIADVPAAGTAVAWLSLVVDPAIFLNRPEASAPGHEVHVLRERVMNQYMHPFGEVLSESDATDLLGDVDLSVAVALLVGPLVMGRLSSLPSFDYAAVARAAVDGFIGVHASSLRKTVPGT